MREEANPAVAAVNRTFFQIGTIAQDGVQRELILTNKRQGAIVLMPIFAKRKNFPDGYDKIARFSVKMLSGLSISSSYSLEAKDRGVGRGGEESKMTHSNGRWKVPDESGKRDDPDKDFPIRQAFTDYSGQARQFVISYFRANLGFGVQAEEEGKDGEGYFFREFDPNSPYLALGRIRGRIRTALATRHIEQQEPGNFQATHQTVRGRISYEAEEVGFVIDGQFITLQQFGKMVETFEGSEFRLDILD